MKPNAYQELIWDKMNPFYKAITNEDTFKQLQLVTIALSLTTNVGEFSSTLGDSILLGELNTERSRDLLLKDLGYLLAVLSSVAKLLGCPLERLMTTSADNFK